MTEDQRLIEIYKQKLKGCGFDVNDNEIRPPMGMGQLKIRDLSDRCMIEAKTELFKQGGFKPYWHEQNPWKDQLVYVPIEQLAECHIMIGKPYVTDGLGSITYRSEHLLDHWSQRGDKLDAYILTGPVLTGGVRYGPEGSEYISAGFSLPRLANLLKKFN